MDDVNKCESDVNKFDIGWLHELTLVTPNQHSSKS